MTGRPTSRRRPSVSSRPGAVVDFAVDDIDEALEIAARHGCHPLRGVATYQDLDTLVGAGVRPGDVLES